MSENIDYFDGIKDHFSTLDTQVIEVPEWGLVGDKAIYCKPFNMLEKQKIFKGATNTDLIVLIDVIIEKALTKDGNKMFNATHILKFKTKADTNIIADVATKIMGTGNVDIEDNKKLRNDAELLNIFSLAEKLHKTVAEILQMTVDEFNMWIAYYQIQNEERDRQERIARAKRGN